MSVPDCTLVTCLYDLTPFTKSSWPSDELIKGIRSLLQTPVYLVIYSDGLIMDKIREIRKPLDALTVYQVVPLEKLWSFQFIDRVKKNRDIYWPTRDDRACAENHLICCNKFDFLEHVIRRNPFDTTKFGWTDACLEKMCSSYNPSKLLKVLDSATLKWHVQILNVVDKKYKDPTNKKEYYQQYRWLISGCFYTCGADIGLKIIDKFKEHFVQTTMLGFGHADEMLFLELLDEFYDDIHRSYGDYKQLFDNFTGVVENVSYVYRYILKGFERMTYPREMYDCAKHLVQQLDRRAFWIDPDIQFNIYFIEYLGSFYTDRSRAKEVVEKIRSRCVQNPLLNAVYLQKKEYYDQQFSYVEGP